jgi:hypothetical protein
MLVLCFIASSTERYYKLVHPAVMSSVCVRYHASSQSFGLMCAQCTRACAAAGVLYVCGSVQRKVVGLLSVPKGIVRTWWSRGYYTQICC